MEGDTSPNHNHSGYTNLIPTPFFECLMSVETIILTSQKDVSPPPPVLLHLAPPVSRQVLGAVVQDSQNLTNKKRRSSWHCSSSQFNKDIPNLHRCSTHFWKMWIWHDVHSYENLSLGKEKKTQHHRHSPPSKNSHLETGGRIEEEQQQSSHIPLA